jgi:transcriptional regulator with XRE-family HTH domain
MAEDTQTTVLNGQILKARRKALKLTQKDVAQYLGVTDAAVSQWERGGGIDLNKLPQLARVLQTAVDELISPDAHNIQGIQDTVSLIDSGVGKRVPLVSLRGLTVGNMAARKQEAFSRNSTSPEIALSETSIAFAIVDESMAPEYQIDEIVTVDSLPFEPGDHIVAHIKTENVTIFRVFEFDGAEHCKLSPINPKHRVLRFTTAEFQRHVDVLGVMVSHLRKRRVRNIF